ncbi:hypothetical protein Dimus_025413 [Dionaea muscipula]
MNRSDGGDISRRRMVGDYIIGPKIGSGSFSVVWKSRHRQSGTEFAIKEIDKRQLNDNLLKEISILKNIAHRNIIRLFESIETQQKIYLVLEYCDGGDLAGYLQRHGRVSEDVARHFMRQLAAGLQVLRDNHLIHRDLKPHNLLLSSKGATPSLKIGDFGFARYLKPQGLADTLCGSPLYMAPEIIQNQKYDAKADLWSVGAILFQLVTGRPPFGGNNQIELFQNILNASELRFPENALKVLHPNCIELCRSLLRRDPVERLTFEEFFNHKFLVGTRVIEDAEQSPSVSKVISLAEKTESFTYEKQPLFHPETRLPSAHPNANLVDEERVLHRKDQHDTSGTRVIRGFVPNTPPSNKIGRSFSGDRNASVHSRVVDSMDSIEREYVLVNSHFASMETLTEEVTSLQESSSGRACGFPPKRSHQHMPVTSYAKEMSTGSVGGMENTSSSGLDSLMAPASPNILREVQRRSVLRPSTRLQLLHQYIHVISNVSLEKHDAGSYLESFSIELVVLAIWKEAIQICNYWLASSDISATSTINETTNLEGVGCSSNSTEIPDFTKPSSASTWAERGFIAACDRAEMLSKYLENVDGTTEIPDAIDIIFRTALDAGKIGAVDELMECRDSADTSYSKAMLLFTFVVEEAPSLALNPPFLLSTADKERIQKYMKYLQSHLMRSQMSTS